LHLGWFSPATARVSSSGLIAASIRRRQNHHVGLVLLAWVERPEASCAGSATAGFPRQDGVRQLLAPPALRRVRRLVDGDERASAEILER
jgi:hypothetical protein